MKQDETNSRRVSFWSTRNNLHLDKCPFAKVLASRRPFSNPTESSRCSLRSCKELNGPFTDAKTPNSHLFEHQKVSTASLRTQTGQDPRQKSAVGLPPWLVPRAFRPPIPSLENKGVQLSTPVHVQWGVPNFQKGDPLFLGRVPKQANGGAYSAHLWTPKPWKCQVLQDGPCISITEMAVHNTMK